MRFTQREKKGFVSKILGGCGMGMFEFLKAKKNTASIAKDRLRTIIAQERTNRAGPDYLPLLQRELLEVIRKYVRLDVAAVQVDVVHAGETDVLVPSLDLPEGRAAPARESGVYG